MTQKVLAAVLVAMVGLAKADSPMGEAAAASNVTMCAYEPCDIQAAADYTVPPLPYPYDSLEPEIDNQTMTFHHDRHFAGYTKKMNKALADMAGMDGTSTVEEMMSTLPTVLATAGPSGEPDASATAFRKNGGGYLNHKMYFATMSPEPQSEPTPGSPLAQAIDTSFGSWADFQEEMTNAAATVFGSGWAFLVLDPVTGELSVIQKPNQDSPYMDGLIPLLGIDVWEHAYYLLRGPDRGDYISAWWDVVDLAKVEEAFARVTAS